MSYVRLEHGFKKFGRQGGAPPLEVLRDFNLSLRQGEFVSVIGPSGCGKSTLFRLLAGMEVLDGGQLFLQGQQVKGLGQLVAYMPQQDMLMPWRTVVGNAVLGLELDGVSLPQAREAALKMLPDFGLESFGDALPRELSGGMRQRVALLRTMLPGRPILLLDEPLGALDSITRHKMQLWLLDVWEKYRPTVLLVTHDVEEAIFMSDRVYVLSPRPASVKLELQVDLPRPRNRESLTEEAFLSLKKEILKVLA
ncbi:MAG TPA: ABC transporter ATP-binding protein [Bacillota bacterium]|nr:ABC transporter ATP-binding protein [Bacillota bacterium]